MATELAGKEDWRSKRKYYALEDKKNFVTNVFDLCETLDGTHNKHGSKKKEVDEKTPRDLEPADTIIHTRGEGPTVQLCGDNEVAGSGSMASIIWDRSTEEKLAKFKNIVLTVEKEDRKSHLSTFSGNTIRKLISGPTWRQRSRGHLLTEATIQRHGRR